MKSIIAGDTIQVRIEAVDEQSGIKKVLVEATNLRDLPGSPTFEATGELNWPDNSDSAVVELTIPEYIPASKWKIYNITLINGTGRSIKFSPSKDFTPILFTVKPKEGIDVTPAELKKVELL